jgi:hypothetical protein
MRKIILQNIYRKLGYLVLIRETLSEEPTKNLETTGKKSEGIFGEINL